MGNLDGKSVIITGAASGIGAATTRRLFADGAFIVAADMDEAGLAGLLESCDDPSRVLTVPTDVTDPRRPRPWPTQRSRGSARRTAW